MKSLTAEELKVKMEENKDLQLIDVREEWEHEAFNIGGKNIPLSDIISRSAEISGESTIVIYCEKGIRSAIAIQRLEAKGIQGLYNLSGGVSRWRVEK